MSKMHASSNQHSEENWEGDFACKMSDSGQDCFFISVRSSNRLVEEELVAVVGTVLGMLHYMSRIIRFLFF